MDTHMDTWQSENRTTASDRAWYQWIAEAQRLAGHSLDGDQATDGYSMDYAYEAWEAGQTAAQYVASTPRPKVGDVVYARWAVGPAQRGSGWIDPRQADELDAWTIDRVWAFGYHVQVPNGGAISISDGQFRMHP